MSLKSKVLISSVRSNLELELLYYRLLQATYLDVKVWSGYYGSSL